MFYFVLYFFIFSYFFSDCERHVVDTRPVSLAQLWVIWFVLGWGVRLIEAVHYVPHFFLQRVFQEGRVFPKEKHTLDFHNHRDNDNLLIEVVLLKFGCISCDLSSPV